MSAEQTAPITAPQRGDVLLFAGGDNPIDRAIVGASLSRYVHAALALDERYYVEAVWPRVRVSTIDAARPTIVARPSYQDAAQAVRACDAAVLLIGEQYDALGVAAFGAGLAFPDWRAAIGATLDHADAVLKLHAQWCSRVVAHALLAAGLALPFGEQCSPGELAAWLGMKDAHI